MDSDETTEPIEHEVEFFNIMEVRLIIWGVSMYIAVLYILNYTCTITELLDDLTSHDTTSVRKQTEPSWS